MCFLIWLCCLVPAAFLMVLIENAGGVELGAFSKLFIGGFAAFIAVMLCRKRKQNKESQESENSSLEDQDDEDDDVEFENSWGVSCLENAPDLLTIKKSLDKGVCPCCFAEKIGKEDDRCYYCDYNLSEQRRRIEDLIKREEERKRKEEENRKDLIESAQIKVSRGTNLIMIYFRPSTYDYRRTEIKLYKDGIFLTEYKVDKEVYFKSIEGLAHGMYEFILKQFDKKNRVIFETDKMSFLF